MQAGTLQMQRTLVVKKGGKRMERETTYHRKCCGLYCAKSWNVRLDQLAGKVFLGALSVFIM
jgi:hypothetical protein